MVKCKHELYSIANIGTSTTSWILHEKQNTICTVAVIAEVTIRHSKCALLTFDNSQMSGAVL